MQGENEKDGDASSNLGVQDHLHMTAGSLYDRTLTDFTVVLRPSSEILPDLLVASNKP